MNQVLCMLCLVWLCSCKLLYHKPIEIYGEINIHYEYQNLTVPINARLKLYDKSFNLLSVVDSSHNGKYLFQFEKSRDKEYYLVMSAIKLPNDAVTIYHPNKFWECWNEPDTLLITSIGAQPPIVIDECVVKVTPGLPSNDGGFIYEKQD
ncbi:hypothetical protein ACFR9R_13855 [Putridiphycobacter roseus]